MAIGEIYSETFKQFDADQLPFNLREKIVLTMDASGTPTQMGGNVGGQKPIVWRSKIITTSVADPVLAFCGSGLARIGAKEGANYSINYVGFGPMEIYVFGAGSVGGAGSGFEMYNEDGMLALCANDLPMRVVGGKTYAIDGGPVDYSPITIPGLKLAGILNASAQVRSEEDDPNDQSNDRALIGKCFIDGTYGSDSVAVSDVTYVTLRIPVDGDDPFAFNTGSFAVIDVTGF